MNIIPSILLAFSASLDSLIIGIAYGIKKIRIGLLINFIIALIVTFGTFISMILGAVVSELIPAIITKYIGSILLICIGIWMLFDCTIREKIKIKKENSSKELIESLCYDEIIINDKTADTNGSGNIEIKEAITLALALSINNFALGLSASMSGLSVTITTIFTFLFSILILVIGLKLGNSVLSKIFGKYSPVLSAIIIILMGVLQLI